MRPPKFPYIVSRRLSFRAISDGDRVSCLLSSLVVAVLGFWHHLFCSKEKRNEVRQR